MPPHSLFFIEYIQKHTPYSFFHTPYSFFNKPLHFPQATNNIHPLRIIIKKMERGTTDKMGDFPFWGRVLSFEEK